MKYFTQRGLSTVEFALVANVVLILMFAVFEVGRAYFVYAMLDEVTRRGARVAVATGRHRSCQEWHWTRRDGRHCEPPWSACCGPRTYFCGTKMTS